MSALLVPPPKFEEVIIPVISVEGTLPLKIPAVHIPVITIPSLVVFNFSLLFYIF